MRLHLGSVAPSEKSGERIIASRQAIDEKFSRDP
jgi:hypothetical protein